MITYKNYKVDLASLQNKKLMYDFAKEMNFDLKAQGNKCTRNPVNLLDSPGLLVFASGFSNTINLSSNPTQLCDRLKLILQEKQAGISFHVISQEIIAIVDKLLEYNSISKKQRKQLLIKSNLLHEQV